MSWELAFPGGHELATCDGELVFACSMERLGRVDPPLQGLKNGEPAIRD